MPEPVVVVLTALETEYAAVRNLLEDLRPHRQSAGTLFEVGTVRGGGGTVALAVTGAGNPAAAVLAERAIAEFSPRAVVFVGIAGALHDDLTLGSVVVATKVYAYHGGISEKAGFRTYPQAWEADHELEQIARSVSRGEWFPDGLDTAAPAVRFRPIAAGEVVLNSQETPLARQLHGTFADAAAIEMEGAGSAKAAHLNRMPYLTVRGISDRADGQKHATDAVGWQPRAARNAAVFAVAVVAQLFRTAREDSRTGSAGDSGVAGITQHVTANGGNAFGVVGGSMYVNTEPSPSGSPMWRRLNRPVEMVWRTGLVDGWSAENVCAFEVHVVPVDDHGRLEVRRLEQLSKELPAFGRKAGWFTATEEVRSDVTSRAAWVRSAGSFDRSRGLAVLRTGQRSAWSGLPSDMLGSVFDPDDIADRVRRSLRALLDLDGVPAPAAVALAAGIESATMVSLDSVARMPRSVASGYQTARAVRVDPEDAVDFAVLSARLDQAAEEIAARVRMAFQQAR